MTTAPNTGFRDPTELLVHIISQVHRMQMANFRTQSAEQSDHE